jgi:hypothetical protein
MVYLIKIINISGLNFKGFAPDYQKKRGGLT